jgi:hypothetical protein
MSRPYEWSLPFSFYEQNFICIYYTSSYLQNKVGKVIPLLNLEPRYEDV